MRLKRIRNALAAMDDDELRALAETAGEGGKPCPPLFDWLAHVAAWEIDRRDGQVYVLRLPGEGLDHEDVPSALAALAYLAVRFRKGGSRAVDELLAAAAELVRGDDAVH